MKQRKMIVTQDQEVEIPKHSKDIYYTFAPRNGSYPSDYPTFESSSSLVPQTGFSTPPFKSEFECAESIEGYSHSPSDHAIRKGQKLRLDN